MLEATVERRLCRRVKALGGKCEKLTTPGRRSCPDRLVTLPGGRIIFVEVKRPGGKPTALQEKDHAERRALGCDVRVIDTVEAADAFPD